MNPVPVHSIGPVWSLDTAISPDEELLFLPF